MGGSVANPTSFVGNVGLQTRGLADGMGKKERAKLAHTLDFLAGKPHCVGRKIGTQDWCLVDKPGRNYRADEKRGGGAPAAAGRRMR